MTRKPTAEEVRAALAELRALVESSEGAMVTRIAQAMETAIRWATEPTVDWAKPAEEAWIMADILRRDLEYVR